MLAGSRVGLGRAGPWAGPWAAPGPTLPGGAWDGAETRFFRGCTAVLGRLRGCSALCGRPPPGRARLHTLAHSKP